MKKLLLAVVIIAGTFTASYAQTGFKAGGGINLAIPANNLKSYSIGAGLDLMAHYGFTDALALTGDVGYTAMFAKKEFEDLKFNVIPLRAGLRFYPSPNFFLAGKAGVGFLNVTAPNNVKSNTTATAYSFGAGYAMDDKLEIGATYDGYSKNGSFGIVNIRLGYWFGNNILQ